jgi:transposase
MDIDKEDARKRSPDAQHEKRKQVIRLHRRSLNRRQISAMTGMGYRSVCRIIDAYKVGGLGALAPKVRGRKRGMQRKLDEAQEQTIQQIICEKRPEQLRMRFALWSRQAVLQLVKSQFGIELAVQTMGEYLKRWGFTPQKPILRTYERCPAKVQRWLDEERKPKGQSQIVLGYRSLAQPAPALLNQYLPVSPIATNGGSRPVSFSSMMSSSSV